MSSINKNTKEISRNYNIDIIQRILDALYEMGKSRIIDSVVHTGLNHHTAKRYLNLMNVFNWIVLEKEENHVVLCLTETGIFAHNQLHNILHQTGAFPID
jgi:predicted transcriptional regulator